MSGGSAPNVIPSESIVVVGVPALRMAEFRARAAELEAALRTEEDPGLALELCASDEGRTPLTHDTLARLVALLDRIPTGVLVPSPRDPAQPFVSNNLGVIREADGHFELMLMSRSPASTELEALAARYRKIAQAEGAELVAGRLVPGWAPDYDSPLLALFQKKHEEQYGRAAEVLEIHAGLECGALQTKYPGMDLISVGPDIFGVHSTEERVSIASTARVFELVGSVIRALR